MIKHRTHIKFGLGNFYAESKSPMLRYLIEGTRIMVMQALVSEL